MSTTVQEFSDLFIGGEWTPALSAGMLAVVSPSTGEVIARVPEPTDADADAAVAAARQAFDEGPWPRLPPAQRAEYIVALRDQFAERLDEFNAAWTAESGPTLAHGAGLHAAVLSVYDDLIARAQTLELSELRELPDGTTVEVIHDPVGVALTITTWNGPGLYVVMKIVPALLAGCTVIVSQRSNRRSRADCSVRCSPRPGSPRAWSASWPPRPRSASTWSPIQTWIR